MYSFQSWDHYLKSWQTLGGLRNTKWSLMPHNSQCFHTLDILLMQNTSCMWGVTSEFSPLSGLDTFESACLVFVRFLFCPWQAHKQEALIPSGVSAGAVFHKVVISPHKGVSNIGEGPHFWANQDLTNSSTCSPTSLNITSLEAQLNLMHLQSAGVHDNSLSTVW